MVHYHQCSTQIGVWHMKKIASLVAVGALVLTGCATNPNTMNTTTDKKAAVLPSVQHFGCQNGLDVVVKHLGGDKIELVTSDNKQAVLSRAVAASGELYVANTGLWGYGGQWHQKGGEAYFEYVGVHGGSAKNTSCTIR